MAGIATVRVLCSECKTEQDYYENLGFECLGCDPIPNDASFCLLKFQKKAAIAPVETKGALVSIDRLDMAVPPARYDDIVKYAPYLNEAMARFGIDTPNRIAAFIAQLAHESGNFSRVEENLNYSWEALRKTWPKRFASDDVAKQYHRNPERIANRAYADRNGNGPEASGDGWKYRGRGLIQITFRDNYADYAKAMSDPTVLSDPSQLTRPRHAAMSAGWFWQSRNLNALADTGTEGAFNEISYAINGGWNGKLARLENWSQARSVLVG